MSSKISNTFFVSSLFALLAFPVMSHAATLMQEGFETDGNGTRYTTSVSEFTDGNDDYFTRTDGSNIDSDNNYYGPEGSYFFAAQDTNGSPGDYKHVAMTFSGIGITGFTNLQFLGLFAEDDASDGKEDWDKNSSLKVFARVDGGSYQTIFAIESTGDNRAPRVDTDLNGVGDGQEITDTFAELSAFIPLVGDVLDLTILLSNLTSSNEDIAFDNLRVTGESILSDGIHVSSAPVPAALPLLGTALAMLGFAGWRRRRQAS